jgi:hypothetical protein
MASPIPEPYRCHEPVSRGGLLFKSGPLVYGMARRSNLRVLPAGT